MTVHVIWALAASIWALALWDMVRRWSFATATRTLKADFDALRTRLDEDVRELEGKLSKRAFLVDLLALRDELGDAKLPARVKQLETVVIALKTHAETQRAARPNPFLRKAPG